MQAEQHVFRIRRNYNRWVANQTLEDYALRFTAKRARRWSSSWVAHTALGAISFLALEAIGGAITLSYGVSNAIAAISVVGMIILLTAIPISYYAAKHGTDIDLLTRGAGFGYIGSTITSLIYASFTFIFFALEAAILSLALKLTLGIPLELGYVISALVVIPIVTHGITLISRVQIWTQPLWILLQLLPLICIAWHVEDAWQQWLSYTPADSAQTSGLNLMAFGAASAVLFSLIAQVGEQVDFLRFLPPKKRHDWRWWAALMAAGPGWIIIGVAKLLIGSFLAVLALQQGFSLTQASDPNHMYLVAFGYLGQSPEFTLLLVGLFVVLSQIKINVTNAYAGSIAWSNFFSRLTHNHPGRVVWLIFNVIIALMLMELGVYRALEQILGVYAIVALAWLGSIVADLVINLPLGLRPRQLDFKRAHLYDINPVGVGSMLIASGMGFIAHMGLLGELAQALSSFIALGMTFICVPVIAWLTQGRYYIARPATEFNSQETIHCCICLLDFEHEDMSYCPAYGDPICSLCCSLDTRCQDSCKPKTQFAAQAFRWFQALLPLSWQGAVNHRFKLFVSIFLLTNLVIAALLTLVYFQINLEQSVEATLVASALFKVFCILLIVSGVVAWMFALAHDSRRMAQDESHRQTQLLMEEIKAHEQTDRELQRAKEVAEAANNAKSRYLTGISHELRSPLNAIMGYAQLLEQDPRIPPQRRDGLAVIRRSSEYLADLIEGLLDISRIEAGRLELSPSEVALAPLLNQIVSMFNLQAKAKGLDFVYHCHSALPGYVRTDEKRLRQILINLLSNAIKYTEQGQVELSVRYRNQVAEFTIADTGVGISQADEERIFRPFERLRAPGQPYVNGTGLGLTISRLLTEIMGGELRFSSQPGVGSEFTLSLMLASVANSGHVTSAERRICGYAGQPRTLCIVDDHPWHRDLLVAMLQPLGFEIVQAADAARCLALLSETQPSIFLLDVSMPGMDGFSLAQAVREQIPSASILMISANAHERPPQADPATPYDDYLVKPLRLPQLLAKLAQHAGIEWHYRQPTGVCASEAIAPHSPSTCLAALSQDTRTTLIDLARIGHAKGIRTQLDQLATASTLDPTTLARLSALTQQFQFAQLIQWLEDSP